VFALALIPPVFGLVGLVFGVVGVRKGDPLGRVSAICCVAATVVGLLFGALLARGQT
jgi:hypothetical protein